MELIELIHPGMTSEEIFLVEERHLATHVGSGAARVLATPWMIAFMEGVSHRLLAKYLPAGYSSVGAHVDVHHLAPTPLGCSVRIRFEVSSRPLGVPVQPSIDLATSISPKMPNRPGILPPHLSPRTLGNTTIPTTKPADMVFTPYGVLNRSWNKLNNQFHVRIKK